MGRICRQEKGRLHLLGDCGKQGRRSKGRRFLFVVASRGWGAKGRGMVGRGGMRRRETERRATLGVIMSMKTLFVVGKKLIGDIVPFSY